MVTVTSTWTNTATKPNPCASDLDKVCTGCLADQESLTVATFKTLQAGFASHLRITDQLAGVISGGLMVTLMIVRMVYDMVRDAISDVIGKLAPKVTVGALTAGLVVPWVVSTAITEVSSWVTRLPKGVTDTILSIKDLRGLLTRASRLLGDVVAAFNCISVRVNEAVTTRVETAEDLAFSLNNLQYVLAGLPGISIRQTGDMGRAKPTVHGPAGDPKSPKTPRPNSNEGRWGRKPNGASAKSNPKSTTNGGEGTPPKGRGNGKGGDGSDPMGDPVIFKPFKGASEADAEALHECAAGYNQVPREGKLSPTRRVVIKGIEIDRQTKRIARQERRMHLEKYPSPDTVAGHIPDGAWLEHGNPPNWQATPSKLNSSLAGQDNNYPVGYKPTEFLIGEGD